MLTATIKAHSKKALKPVQLSLSNSVFKEPPRKFGGSLLKNSNPKIARPITTQKAMHVVMRSRIAKYEWSFLHYKNKKKVENIIRRNADRFNIKIYKLGICYNHFHMLIKLQTRDSYNKFIRAISGLIAKIVLGAEKGRQKGIKFWDSRPFSRITEWVKDFINAKKYVLLNKKEAEGLVPYQTRKHRYGST